MYKYCYSNLGAIYAKGLWAYTLFLLELFYDNVEAEIYPNFQNIPKTHPTPKVTKGSLF